jgi:hypothetical protein
MMKTAVDTTAGTSVLGNFTAADKAFSFAGAPTLSFEQAHVDPGALTGSASRCSETVRKGLEVVNGDTSYLVTPETLEFFMPFVTGRAWATGVTYPDSVTPAAYHQLVHRDAALYIYDALRINQCTIAGTSGEPLKMTFSHIGRTRPAPTEAVIATVDQWPTGLNVDKSVPYMFEDVVIALDGVQHNFRSFEIAHNNNLIPVYFGSTKSCGAKRNGLSDTTLNLTGKHTYNAIQTLMQAALAGIDVVMTLTHPNAAFTAIFRFQAWQVPEKDVPGAEGEMLLPSAGTARTLSGGDSEGAEWIITNDAVLV